MFRKMTRWSLIVWLAAMLSFVVPSRAHEAAAASSPWLSHTAFYESAALIGAGYSGVLTVEFDVTPAYNQTSGVIGYADTITHVNGYADLVIMVRMNGSGLFDAFDATGYRADATVAYSASTTYRIHIDADLTTRQYNVWVTPTGGSAVQLANQYSFQTGTSIDDLGQIVCISEPVDQAFSVSNHTVTQTYGRTLQVGPTRTYTTLNAVAGSLLPGDLVLVDGDATYGGGILMTIDGLATNKITIRGVTINGKKPKLSGGTNTIEFRQADHYVLENFEITGGSSRCVYHYSDDLTLRGITLHGCYGHGIASADLQSGHIVIEYSDIFDSGNSSRNHPIYVESDQITHPGAVARIQFNHLHGQAGGNNIKSRSEITEIYYNRIEGAYYHEIELIGRDYGDAPLYPMRGEVVGNLIVKNTTNSSYVFRLGGDTRREGSEGRYRIANNTVISTTSSTPIIYRLMGKLGAVESHNNVFYRTTTGALDLEDSSSVNWISGRKIAGANNWVKSGSVDVPVEWAGTLSAASPALINIWGNDFRPGASSPLVDAGTLTQPSPVGYPYPAGGKLVRPLHEAPMVTVSPPEAADTIVLNGPIDIGAYEY